MQEGRHDRQRVRLKPDATYWLNIASRLSVRSVRLQLDALPTAYRNFAVRKKICPPDTAGELSV
jgi:hypothetical protein